MIKNVVKNIMPINALVHCLGTIGRHSTDLFRAVGTSFPRNASVVLAGPSSSSSSSSSFHMTAKTPEKYVIPARFCILW
jgi:hypothetical protein